MALTLTGDRGQRLQPAAALAPGQPAVAEIAETLEELVAQTTVSWWGDPVAAKVKAGTKAEGHVFIHDAADFAKAWVAYATKRTNPKTNKVSFFKLPVMDAEMPESLGPGHAATVKPLTLTWPSLGNMGVFQPSPGENQWGERNVHWWVDQTKPPYVPG